MGLKARFTKADISKYIEQKRENIRSAILNRLELTGFEFVKLAREKTAAEGGFNDVTGNLRSSIGFAIVDHGSIKLENYEKSNSGSGGGNGIQEAKTFIATLSDKFESGYALIVVAGMSYAAAVESRGKDVITGSSIIVEETLKQAIQRLKSKI